MIKTLAAHVYILEFLSETRAFTFDFATNGTGLSIFSKLHVNFS
ncbi:RAxF-45 family protein [Paenisporosarcina cavernae]